MVKKNSRNRPQRIILFSLSQALASLSMPSSRISWVLKAEATSISYSSLQKLSREVFTINGHFDHDNIYEGAVITLMDNEEHRFMAKVVKIEEDGVTVDTNHPLAGKTLNFTGKVIENREATDDEVQRLIKHLTGGCSGCGHHHGEGEGCEGCGDGCGHDHHHDEGCGCGHCH